MIRQDERPRDATVDAFRRALSADCAWRAVVRPDMKREWSALSTRIDGEADLTQTAYDAKDVLDTLPVLVCADNRLLSEHTVEFAEYLDHQGYHELAMDLLQTCLDYQRRQFPDLGWLHLTTENAMGAALARVGRVEEARRELIRTYHPLAGRGGLAPNNERLRQAVRRMIELYELIQKPGKADYYRSLLPAAAVLGEAANR